MKPEYAVNYDGIGGFKIIDFSKYNCF